MCVLSDIDSLPEMDPVAFVHHSANVTEAVMVDGALDEYSEESSEHDYDLEDVRPHDCLHAALEREEFGTMWTCSRASVVLAYIFSVSVHQVRI